MSSELAVISIYINSFRGSAVTQVSFSCSIQYKVTRGFNITGTGAKRQTTEAVLVTTSGEGLRYES